MTGAVRTRSGRLGAAGRSGVTLAAAIAWLGLTGAAPAESPLKVPADVPPGQIRVDLARGPIPVQEPGNTSVVGCSAPVLANNLSTSTSGRAPHVRVRFIRSVYLITATEMAASGWSNGMQPARIGWNYSTAPGLPASVGLIVYMQNTSDATNLKSTTWSTAIAGMTTVHNATTTLPNVTGPWDVTLTGGSPFTYTGGGLYIAFDMTYPSGTLSTTAVVSCNNTLANGILTGQANTSSPTTVTASSFRPETRLAAVAGIANDISVDLVVAMGSLPNGLVPAQTPGAVISNRGLNPLTNLPVSLNFSGAESYSDTQNVASIAGCTGTATVIFAPYTPSALGSTFESGSCPRTTWRPTTFGRSPPS